MCGVFVCLRRGLLTAVPLVLLLAAPARAAMVGSIFSGPTSGDPAAIYWNPGAMPLMRGTKALGFGAISFIRLHHQRLTPSLYDKQMYPQANVFVPKPALALGVVTDATLKDFRFGVGVTLPILDGAGWDDKYGGKEASTRYFALNARLGFIKISPAVAYRISRHISVGVGIDIVGVMLTHEVMTDFGAKINQMACDMNNTQCMVDAPLPREDPSMDALNILSSCKVRPVVAHPGAVALRAVAAHRRRLPQRRRRCGHPCGHGGQAAQRGDRLCLKEHALGVAPGAHRRG